MIEQRVVGGMLCRGDSVLEVDGVPEGDRGGDENAAAEKEPTLFYGSANEEGVRWFV